MRRILLAQTAAGALVAVGVVLLTDRSASCEVLAERDLFDSMSDFDESDPKSTIEEAVEDAFADAGTPRQVEAMDLDPIIRAHPDGNLIHVGIDGYWVMLATIQSGDGLVWVEPPRPCSTLQRFA
jgi:hypothetical protein